MALCARKVELLFGPTKSLTGTLAFCETVAEFFNTLLGFPAAGVRSSRNEIKTQQCAEVSPVEKP